MHRDSTCDMPVRVPNVRLIRVPTVRLGLSSHRVLLAVYRNVHPGTGSASASGFKFNLMVLGVETGVRL